MALIDRRLIAIFYICCLLFPRSSHFLDIMDQCPIGFKDLETLHLQLKPPIRDNEHQNCFYFWQMVDECKCERRYKCVPCRQPKTKSGMRLSFGNLRFELLDLRWI